MEQKPQKFIIDVAPIARLPLAKQQYFSYLASQKLEPGTLVLVPLFRRDIEGVVLDARPDFERTGGYELKNISRVLIPNFLTFQQLKFAQQLSEYYLTSLGVVLKHFLPKRVIARATSNQKLVTSKKKIDISLTIEQQEAVNKIANRQLPVTSYQFLLLGAASSGKTEVYIHSILKLKQLNPKKQFLILLPELTLTPQALQRYGQYFNQDEIVLLHSKLGKGEFFREWEKIRSGQAKIIISTRIGIFAPFQDLGAVFVDEEQDMSFKQWDMNPRYDARKSAEFLAENFGAPIVFGTATPRIESFYKTEKNDYNLLEIPVLNSKIMGREKLQPDIEIVDMRKEKWTDFSGKKKPNHSLLSTRLQDEISYAIKENKQVILFVNHQGLSKFSVCTSCKAVLKCPKCDRALVYDESGEYKCLHCSFKESIVPQCKGCKGIVFQNIGIGTGLVEREVKKLFASARIARLDSTAAKKPGAQAEIFRNFSNGNFNVLIGTQMITKGWDNPNVILVGIIDADSLFSAPDYLTDERAFNNVMQISGRTGRVGSQYPGHVIIQTFNPQHPIFDFVTNRDYKGFYNKEIKQREALSYPPFGQIIKLTCKDELKEKVEKETQVVFEKLFSIASVSKNLKIMEPSDPMVSKVRGKFLKQIIIKKSNDLESLPIELVKIIGSLSSSWLVDVDPISIA